MNVFHVINSTINGAGNRAAAQMGVLRVDHPDILDFIRAKQDEHSLTTMNLSVGITDEFMATLEADTTFDLRWGDRHFSTVNARDLWAELMRSTWDFAEPGVLFIDTINKWNNLWYCEKIAATNPCGEQPLPPNGACLLGSFNLPAYMNWSEGAWEFDFAQFAVDIPPVVRAMDNVVDRARYPLPPQELEAKSKRRMGLGVMGLANAVEALGAPYGCEAFLDWSARILTVLRDGCYRASVALAEEKGAFPLWDKEKYAAGRFINTLPIGLQADIKTHGIRNSHLTSIAPTGTISLTADNVSGGIEPVFAHSTLRMVKMADGPELVEIADYGVARFGVKGRTAEQCSVDDHLNVLLMAQQHVDSAVSKTCNVGSEVTWEEFNQVYVRAWKGGAKGCTTYRGAGKRQGVLTDATAPKLCFIDGSCSD
jgi:ribonucleoside-diphosphate reductase alpha chain